MEILCETDPVTHHYYALGATEVVSYDQYMRVMPRVPRACISYQTWKGSLPMVAFWWIDGTWWKREFHYKVKFQDWPTLPHWALVD